MDTKKNIDFRFFKNWKRFMSWYDAYYAKAKCAPLWEYQSKKIEEFFEESNPQIVNWKVLWKDFYVWYKEIMKKNEVILFSEQKRQVETLMLIQLKELNNENFILVFLHNGKPEIDTQKMSYWEALRVKGKLEGDENGFGGNEDMECITIVNLNKLIQ